MLLNPKNQKIIERVKLDDILQLSYPDICRTTLSSERLFHWINSKNEIHLVKINLDNENDCNKNNYCLPKMNKKVNNDDNEDNVLIKSTSRIVTRSQSQKNPLIEVESESNSSEESESDSNDEEPRLIQKQKLKSTGPKKSFTKKTTKRSPSKTKDASENKKSKSKISNKINNNNSCEKNNKRPRVVNNCLEAEGDVFNGNDENNNKYKNYDNDNGRITKTPKLQKVSEEFYSNIEERKHYLLKEERKREEQRHHLAMMEIIES